MTESHIHLSNERVAAYLEGVLADRERAQMERHLAACPDCLRHVAGTAALLAEANLLPPPSLYHPLERVLRWFQRWIPLPILGWHIALESLAYILWAATVGLAGRPIPWHASARLVLMIWPVLLVTTTHMLWLQPQFRSLVRGFWRAGASPYALRLLERRIAWLQGWPLGGLWLFVGLEVINNISNILGSRPVPLEYAKDTVIGLYEGLAWLALLWGTICGGFVWHAVAAMLRDQPALRASPVVEGARAIALGWVALASIGATAYLLIAARIAVSAAFLYAWATIVTGVLLLLWAGYAHLELRLSHRGGRSGWQHVAFGLRLTGALILTLIPPVIVLF
jgi:hypothetical protein